MNSLLILDQDGLSVNEQRKIGGNFRNIVQSMWSTTKIFPYVLTPTFLRDRLVSFDITQNLLNVRIHIPLVDLVKILGQQSTIVQLLDVSLNSPTIMHIIDTLLEANASDVADVIKDYP